MLPNEGGGLTMEAYAIPSDAPHIELDHDLLNFLMWPEVARRNADAARLVDAYAADEDDTLKLLSPEGAYNPSVAPLVQMEWETLVSRKAAASSLSGKAAASPPSESGGQKPHQRVNAHGPKRPRKLQ